MDFPERMISRLDLETDRLGVHRQSLINVWIAERLAATRKEKRAEPARAANRSRGRCCRRWPLHTEIDLD